MNAPSTAAQESFIDPKALMQIRNLELRARVVVQGFWNGLHRSPYHGFSVEFTEYRQYVPGDDPRHLDWRVYARHDRYVIKKYEDETNLRCHLIVDQSRSMNFGTTGWSKAEYAHTLAATLGYFLHLQGDAVGLLSFDGNIREYLPARHRHGHLRQLMLALDQPAEGQGTDLGRPLRRIVELVHKRGLMVLVSDLLAPLDELEEHLAQLTASGHEVVVFRVLDPEELHFKSERAERYHDLEDDRDLFIDPATAREGYLRRFREHADAAEKLCGRLGIDFRPLATDEPLDRALFDYLQQRQLRGKQVRRRTQSAA